MGELLGENTEAIIGGIVAFGTFAGALLAGLLGYKKEPKTQIEVASRDQIEDLKDHVEKLSTALEIVIENLRHMHDKIDHAATGVEILKDRRD